RPVAFACATAARHTATAAPLATLPCAAAFDGSTYVGTPTWSPTTRNCSIAAGLWRSAAARIGWWPLPTSILASLPQVVVLPDPWRPHIMMTVGGGWTR